MLNWQPKQLSACYFLCLFTILSLTGLCLVVVLTLFSFIAEGVDILDSFKTLRLLKLQAKRGAAQPSKGFDSYIKNLLELNAFECIRSHLTSEYLCYRGVTGRQLVPVEAYSIGKRWESGQRARSETETMGKLRRFTRFLSCLMNCHEKRLCRDLFSIC